ncbi:MAG: hypothetical protein ABH847_04540 [Candidatus Omnitrophota bacterium]
MTKMAIEERPMKTHNPISPNADQASIIITLNRIKMELVSPIQIARSTKNFRQVKKTK